MKRILINEKNAARIIELINEVNSKARERTLSYSTVLIWIDNLTKKFSYVPKCKQGYTFIYEFYGEFPNRYKWDAMGTTFTLENIKGKFYLIDVSRKAVNYGHNRIIKVSESMEDIIINNAIAL